MANEPYEIKHRDGGNASVTTRYICSTDAGKPAATLTEGDMAWCGDTEKLYIASDGTNWRSILKEGTASNSTILNDYLQLQVTAANHVAGADTLNIGCRDLSAGNTIVRINTEGSGITGAGMTNVTPTVKVAININGNVYYLLATTNGT